MNFRLLKNQFLIMIGVIVLVFSISFNLLFFILETTGFGLIIWGLGDYTEMEDEKYHERHYDGVH